MDEKSVKVRFAPSPTGSFSLGNVRTALFNWLFARRQKGEFFLRIEDTDSDRSKAEFEEGILLGLKWLGLNWDGDVIKQSERGDVYKKYLETLLSRKEAYYCFCTEEEIEAQRQIQLSHGIAPKYGGQCRRLTEEETKKRINLGERAVIRFKIPEKIISFNDEIRGRVEFNTSLIGDIIIARDLRRPFYNFAAAVDDGEMEITHVIRGEDHLSNTPKQILIQMSLGFKVPVFVHLPLILEPGGKKLSKRTNPKSLFDYKAEGYLPEAMLNFLVLLGWHPEKDREIVTPEEMEEEFSLKRVQKSGAVFNEKKLDWLNAYYIKNLPSERVVDYLRPFIPSEWFDDNNLLIKIVELEKERAKRLIDFKELSSFFFKPEEYETKLLIWKDSSDSDALNNLREVLSIIKNAPENNFPDSHIGEKIMILGEKKGKGNVFWPLRTALSGRAASPGPLEIMEVLGKNKSVNRLEKAIAKLENEA